MVINHISVRHGIYHPPSTYPYQPRSTHPPVHHHPSFVKTASQQVHSSLQQALRWSKDCQQFSVSFVAACPSVVVATANNEKRPWIFSQTPSRSMGGLSHSQWECIHKPLLVCCWLEKKRWCFSPFFTAVDGWKPTRLSQTLVLTHFRLKWLSLNQLESRWQARNYMILNIQVPWI